MEVNNGAIVLQRNFVAVSPVSSSVVATANEVVEHKPKVKGH